MIERETDGTDLEAYYRARIAALEHELANVRNELAIANFRRVRRLAEEV